MHGHDPCRATYSCEVPGLGWIGNERALRLKVRICYSRNLCSPESASATAGIYARRRVGDVPVRDASAWLGRCSEGGVKLRELGVWVVKMGKVLGARIGWWWWYWVGVLVGGTASERALLLVLFEWLRQQSSSSNVTRPAATTSCREIGRLKARGSPACRSHRYGSKLLRESRLSASWGLGAGR